MKIYTIMDTDMNYVFGAYKSLSGVVNAAVETLTDCGYARFEVIGNMEEDEWYIHFPHTDPNCEGHWTVTRIEVED